MHFWHYVYLYKMFIDMFIVFYFIFEGLGMMKMHSYVS